AAAVPHGGADDAALPSFGGGGLGGLTAAPLIAPAAPVDQAAAVAAAAPVAQPPRSQAPLYIMMVFLLLAVMGLVAFVVLREPETKIVKETVTAPGAAPSVKDSDKDDDKDDKDKDDDDKDDKDKDDDKDDKDDDGKDEKSADDGDSDKADGGTEAVAAASSSGKKKSKNTRKKAGGGGGSKAQPKSSGDPLADALGGGSKPKDSGKKAGGGGGGDPGIDCILDPSKCGSGKKKASKPKPSGGTDPNLPEKLTSADIKKGVAPHKGAAKSCGGKHGGSAGEKVTVKLSISGGTGKVTSAAATGKHAGTPLGNCVAQALKKAKFSKFKKASLGVQYPIRL
ncbi:MAG: hypothetical protein AAF721_37170, partial [Myxococcota bacterium]